MNKHKLIEISEYLFLGLTIVGSVGAAMTQQVVYVAVPLTFSIALNLINRPRFNNSQSPGKIEQLQADLDNFTNRIDQLQTTLEKSHRQLVTSEPITESMNEVNIVKIAERLENLTTAFNQNSQEFIEITDRLSEVEIAIELITQTVKKQGEELQSLEKLENVENLEFNFSQIREEIRSKNQYIEYKFSELEQKLANLRQSPQNFSTELHPYPPQADNSLESSLEIPNMSTEFGELYNQVETNYSTTTRDAIQDTVSLEFDPDLYNTEMEVDQNLLSMETAPKNNQVQFNQHPENEDFYQTIPMLEFDQLIPTDFTEYENNKLISGANLTGHKGKVLSVAFSPDSKVLVSGSDDKTIKIWNLETQQHRTLAGHQDAAWLGSVNTVAFSIDGQLIASGSDDKTIRIWDVKTGDKIITFTGHEEKIHSLAFNPLGKILASGSKDKTVKIWHLEKQKEIYSLQVHKGDVLCVVFSPDGKLLATAGDGQDGSIKIIKLAESKVRSIKVNSDLFNGGINTLAFSPNGRILASGDNNKVIKLWDVETSQEIAAFSEHSDQVLAIAFSPDGKLLASASKDKTVKVWDLKQGVEIASVQCGDEVIYSVAFSPDGKLIAAGSGDQTITLLPANS